MQYLQPALTLDDQGNLYAVWHEKYEAGEGDTIHRVLYSRSNNPTAETPSWEDEKVFATLSADEQAFSADNVSARIAVSGTWAEPHVHVVLMLDSGSAWDVWYLSNQTYSSVLLPIILRNP